MSRPLPPSDSREVAPIFGSGDLRNPYTLAHRSPLCRGLIWINGWFSTVWRQGPPPSPYRALLGAGRSLPEPRPPPRAAAGRSPSGSAAAPSPACLGSFLRCPVSFSALRPEEVVHRQLQTPRLKPTTPWIYSQPKHPGTELAQSWASPREWLFFPPPQTKIGSFAFKKKFPLQEKKANTKTASSLLSLDHTTFEEINP